MERLPSLFQINDNVSLTFPDNGILKKGTVIKVAFTAHSEPLYDVEVPFSFYSDDDLDTPHTGSARIHGLKEWHLRNPESPISDRVPIQR